ncbi:MAG: hypothetical protein HUU03_09735 [Planctomycetaceae bacterium]|nr:hypothetical protein [Planctomycetota bacterium]MCQ3948471.1 hypothetical protein [Planctomycetota bacterium]NUO16708.1 hypothetical protein [Planctomycetaceae bacterium]GIK51337.1 MAG: hypothetical protein BroJett014_03100 [Planctomycetota bacterium]HRJ76991.1 hypothetical protein [Planctomycetota bacterium]
MRVLTVLLLALGFFACGCASSQARPSRVGEIGLNSAYERALSAENNARRTYEFSAPKTGALIRSEPPGATIEWLNHDGTWVTVGSTPSKQIVIEATGKPELFRVSRLGFLPQTRWVASTGGRGNVEVMFELEPDLPVGHGVKSGVR